MKVFLYPDRTWAELGEIRFEISVWVVKSEAIGKDEIDFDRDIAEHAWGFKTEEEARAYAAEVLKRDDLAFGVASLQKQVVDWFVREDHIAEWSNVGESEEISQ